MKIYWRIMSFARPIQRYAIPYFFYTLFHAIFNAFNFAMLVPILNILFNSESMAEKVYVMPDFSVSLGYLQDSIKFFLFKTYGESYNIMQVLLFVALILVTSALFSNLFRYLGQRTMENMKIHTLQKIRDSVFDNIMTLEIGYFSNERRGDIIAKITSDVQVVQYCITSTLQAVFRDPFLIMTYMIMLVGMSWQLTIFSGLFLPVVAFVIGTIVKRLRRQATAGQETYADMVSIIEETLGGMKVINAYNDTEHAKGRFHTVNKIYSRIMRSMARRQQLSSPMSEFLGIAAMAVMLLFGGNLVINGTLDSSVFIAYLAIFSQITRPVRSFADAFANINQGIAAGERVLTLLDTKSNIVDKPNAIELNKFDDKIEMRDVCFSYSEREVICGVNMTINRGETIALVGPSGGGKTTISDLIPRFYDVSGGGIFIDGVDIRDYTLTSLRSQIGVVSQDTVLFNDTIEGNIRMGRREATMEEIVEAAKIANAHSFIMETDNGYQTNIGDRGMKLSGGQRQRLSIARAVLKNPEILILDEATSALDTESEKLVQEALDTLLMGRTSIIIAHRLSTIVNADKIMVVEEGMIVEEGTHQELVENDGTYAKLVSMQYMS